MPRFCVIARLLPLLLNVGCTAPATKVETAHAASTPSAKTLLTQLDRQAPQWLQQFDVPSVAIAYIENGKLAWTAVYGEQSPGNPATEKTLYNLASLTKPISAELILRLAANGVLSLDEPMFPYWVDPDIKDNPWSKRLTPRLCLTHQTGFKNWRRQTQGVLAFQWEPGTNSGYSGEGYDYVGRFAEKKTGRSFEELAQAYVFNPIGMKETAYTKRDWFEGRLAQPHGPKGETEPRNANEWTAADLVRTTVGDYAKFILSVMQRQGLTREIADQQMISTRNTVTAADMGKLCAKAGLAAASCSGSAGMGLGWEIIELNGATIIDHGGSDWGVRTQVFFDPNKQTGAVILTNGDNGREVIAKVVGLLYPDPLFIATL
jgi:CubicO group peptidase (beta-lactamase class C family)